VSIQAECVLARASWNRFRGFWYCRWVSFTAAILAPGPFLGANPAVSRSDCAVIASFNNPAWVRTVAPGDNLWCCDLVGITCMIGRIVFVLAANAGLFGPLPANMSQLNMTQQLDLSGNALTGTLDPLRGMSSLYLANLGSNRFSGTLSPIAAVPSLTALFLNNNQLTGDLLPLRNNVLLQQLLLNDNMLVRPQSHICTRFEFKPSSHRHSIAGCGHDLTMYACGCGPKRTDGQLEFVGYDPFPYQP
jgi:hypothetical protein